MHAYIGHPAFFFENATDEATCDEMYAHLCRKMMEQMSPNVQDESIRNTESKPITSGLFFCKYLLNRCQDFKGGRAAKDPTAAMAKAKASENQAVEEANEKVKEKEDGDEGKGEVSLYSDEYYAAQKAKRQGLGLVKFTGELFKQQMLAERIMHECIKNLLSNVDNPEEKEIESLCKPLTTVGQALDTLKVRGHMDVYFSQMTELAKSSNVTLQMQPMLRVCCFSSVRMLILTVYRMRLNCMSGNASLAAKRLRLRRFPDYTKP